MTRTAALAVALDQHQESVIETILDFEAPKGSWLLQRPDGWFYQGYVNEALGDVFVAEASKACGFHSEASVLRLLDILRGTARGREAFRDCKPVCVAPLLEPGDFVVCACGSVHERDYCPTQAGHGAIL